MAAAAGRGAPDLETSKSVMARMRDMANRGESFKRGEKGFARKMARASARGLRGAGDKANAALVRDLAAATGAGGSLPSG